MKEITREFVLIPCDYCRGLMPQTLLFARLAEPKGKVSQPLFIIKLIQVKRARGMYPINSRYCPINGLSFWRTILRCLYRNIISHFRTSVIQARIMLALIITGAVIAGSAIFLSSYPEFAQYVKKAVYLLVNAGYDETKIYQIMHFYV